MKEDVLTMILTRRVGAFLLCVAAVALFQIVTAPSAFAATDLLGNPLDTFAVLGGQTVTNTGATTITSPTGNANIGVSPGSSITGLATITINGVNGATLPAAPFEHLGDATANLAQSETVTSGNLDTALSLLSGLSATGGSIPGGVLNGLTLTQGVYAVSAAAGNGGFNLGDSIGTIRVLTLDAQGSTNPFWVFQMSSTLITGSNTTIQIINPGGGINFNPGVFWEVGSSATLGNSSVFVGNILAETSITLNSAAKITCGSALADTGAVTLNNNTISTGCFGSLSVTTPPGGGPPVVIGPPGSGGTGGTPLPTPEPDTLLLLGASIAGFWAVRPRLTRGR